MTAVEVKREPLVYDRHAPTSWFKDQFLAMRGDVRAQRRLELHGMQVEHLARRRRDVDAEFRALDEAGLEYRITPNVTQGQGGYFAPPGWLVDEFKTAARPRRVLTGLMPSLPLPDGVQSINLPKLVTGTQAQVQDQTAAVPSQDVVDANATSQVVTIAGNADYSLPSLEQSPPGAHLDWAIFKDLSEAYDAQLETQSLVGAGGTGPNAQLNGVTTVAVGAGIVTYTDASPTVPEMYPFFGQAVAAIGDNRKLPPQAWLMRTARWGWIATSLDDQHRPLVPPGTHPAGPTQLELAGFPVFLDDAIPANLGAGTNQDIVITLRYDGFLLLEGTPRSAVMMEPLSGTLGVRFQWRNYAALVSTAYTSAVATVGGTGMVVQSGF